MLDAARSISTTSEDEREQKIKEFNDKYCTHVYTGPFLAGGWLRSIASAKTTKEVSSEILKKV